MWIAAGCSTFSQRWREQSIDRDAVSQYKNTIHRHLGFSGVGLNGPALLAFEMVAFEMAFRRSGLIIDAYEQQ